MRMAMNWKMKMIAAAVLTAMLLMIAACGGNGAGNEPSAAPSNAASSPEASATVAPEIDDAATAATVYPLTIKDDMGTELTFEKAPAKVVTLVPSETEVIYAIGGADLVAGVDTFSNYPAEAAAKPKVGDMTTNIEAVAALSPDLVLASSTMNTDAITKLRELNIAVFASDPLTYDATIAKIENIGRIIDHNKEASEVAAHMREVKQQVADAVKDAPKKSVYLEFSPGWTVGSGTFLDELLTIAGGTNVASAQPGWYEVSAEEIVKQNPQVIIYPDMGESNPITAAIADRPGWNAIDAVKNKQQFAVTNDPLVRVGPRLADGLLELAKAIHPDLFK
ncbi:ABC transporter substrate-binding protein [Paenibacillus sp. NEAU-GSW1]|uniref:ABC transporter substrate-binding protein n=1 Tax=Paenibacillus sp. NEAU-GSW1 TaxID=2682486 RepID=UPI0012E2AEAD|nr:ABC transporter substrate-binding protein [Paenibacillus sp. NEAU-GSW1]MUT67023.1 ABC transporter substrate-binding protein [Paenibacillus sp. NEAU-GSW1]